MRFFGKIRGGKLQSTQQQKLSNAIRNGEGKWFEISIGFRGRSIPQNAYYHGVIIKMIADETGQPEREIHDFLKTKFLRRRVTIGKNSEVVVGSTADLDTAEFEEYTEKCRRWATEFLNLTIPLPNEDLNE